jgi:hypothetical protein
LKEPEDLPWMGNFWGGSEDIAKDRDGIIIGKSIRFDESGARDIVEKKLVDEVRVFSWLNERTQVSDDKRRSLDVLPAIGRLGGWGT